MTGDREQTGKVEKLTHCRTKHNGTTDDPRVRWDVEGARNGRPLTLVPVERKAAAASPFPPLPAQLGLVFLVQQ